MRRSVELIDLRSITVMSSRTVVQVVSEVGEKLRWIDAGACRIHHHGSSGAKWTLDVPLAETMADEECDRVCLRALSIDYSSGGMTCFHATIGRGWSSFRVPSPGYDPRVDAKVCAAQGCHRKGHLVVPYLPPENPKLADAMAGRDIEILIGPAECFEP